MPADTASGLAVELFEELRLRLHECGLVLALVTNCEADLNLDELESTLYEALRLARTAFGAAYLLNHDARLDVPWTSGASRPKAVFARHLAAVRAGAPRTVIPEDNLVERIERWLSRPIDSHRPNEDADPKPPACAAIAATSGKPCTRTAMRVGSVFVEHCYSHLTSAERDRLDKQRQRIAAAEAEHQLRLDEVVHRAGTHVAADWLHQRQTRREWIAILDPEQTTPPVPAHVADERPPDNPTAPDPQ